MTARVAVNVRQILRICFFLVRYPDGPYSTANISRRAIFALEALNPLAGIQLHHVQLDQGAAQKRSAYIHNVLKVRWCSRRTSLEVRVVSERAKLIISVGQRSIVRSGIRGPQRGRAPAWVRHAD